MTLFDVFTVTKEPKKKKKGNKTPVFSRYFRRIVMTQLSLRAVQARFCCKISFVPKL